MFVTVGRLFALIFIVFFAIVFYALIEYSKTHKVAFKKLAAYDAIAEAVGRAAELGRPVLCQCGQRDLDNSGSAATLAALSVLSYVAKLCAEVGVKLYVPSMLRAIYPLQVQIVREAYKMAGKPEEFDETNIRFLTPDDYAYTMGVISLLEREKVAANIMVGQTAGISLILTENSYRLGCFGIGGTEGTAAVFFIPTMDYTLIGDEMYALASYIEKDPIDTGTIFAKDVMKLTVVLIILIGVTLTVFGFNFSKLVLGA